MSKLWLHSRFPLEVVTYFLGRGFSPDTHRDGRADNDTSLCNAVRANSRKGAELAQLLLENGANPNLRSGSSRRLAKDLAGAKLFPKWLGITFDELVESTWGARQQVRDADIPALANSPHARSLETAEAKEQSETSYR